jgi:hypothetical protein
MRYATAVRRLRQIAADAHRANWPDEDPLLVAAYTFGPILDAPDDVAAVDVALVLDCPAEEVPWGTQPPWAVGIVEMLRLNKAPVRWRWRPAVWPVWNHQIQRPVRIWSVDGPDEQALQALADRQAAPLRLPAPSEAEQAEQVAIERDTARIHLRRISDHYWEPEWRSDHKGFGIYPENHLWDAVWGYLNLLDATQ